jgi:hypothetical protein
MIDAFDRFLTGGKLPVKLERRWFGNITQIVTVE